MKRPKLATVRARLTLWNVVAVALILAGSGLAVRYTVRLSLLTGIDADLQMALTREKGMTNHFLDRPPAEPRGGDDPGGDGRDDGLGDLLGFDDGGGHHHGGGPDDHHRDGPGRPFGSRMIVQWFGPPPGSRGPRGDRWRRLREPFLPPGIYDLKGKPLTPVSADKIWNRAAYARSLKGETLLESVSVSDAPVRLISSPVRRAGKTVGVMQMVRPLDELEQLMANLDRTLLLLLVPALAVAGLSGAFLADRSLRPVRRFSQATSELGASNLSLRLPVRGKDEFAELAANFNRMTERLETAFENQRRFTADASHELRTPLAAIKLYTSMALFGGGSPETYRKALEEADSAAGEMGRIIDDLLFLARSDNHGLRIDAQTFAVRDLLDSAAETRSKREGAPVRIELSDPGLTLTGDPHHLKRLLQNLLENALRHTPPEGALTLSAEGRESAVLLRVEDTGEGIPPDHLPRVFDRFYRADDARSRTDGGAGLGLSICRTIAEAHGGSIALDSRPGEGTVVTVTLPGEGSASRADLPEKLRTEV